MPEFHSKWWRTPAPEDMTLLCPCLRMALHAAQDSPLTCALFASIHDGLARTVVHGAQVRAKPAASSEP